MTVPLVAIIDCFEPSIVETIQSTMPTNWKSIAIKESTVSARKNALSNATIALLMGAPMNEELFKSAPKLKFVQKMGAGIDNIDIKYCASNGIGVARLSAGNDIPVAEHTVMMILAATRRLIHLDKRTRDGAWDKETARGINKQVHGKTVGIIGLGAIGRRVAKILKAFDADIIYCDPIPAPDSLEKELNLKRVNLDQLLVKSDIISLHLPQNEETRLIIEESKIAMMKPDAILINCARGGLVDEKALTIALKNGHLFGAGLDTFSTEPPINNSLLLLDNIVLSPHCAGATLDNFQSIANRTISNCTAFITNKPLPKFDVVHDPRKVIF
jgi:phosphoglycerate dehydrogenase-like enzyme